MMKLIGVGLLMLLAGCQGLGGSNLTAEQITAMAKDKNGSAFCAQIVTAGSTIRIVSVNLDKGTIPSGGISVDPTDGRCTVLMTNDLVVKVAK